MMKTKIFRIGIFEIKKEPQSEYELNIQFAIKVGSPKAYRAFNANDQRRI